MPSVIACGDLRPHIELQPIGYGAVLLRLPENQDLVVSPACTSKVVVDITAATASIGVKILHGTVKIGAHGGHPEFVILEDQFTPGLPG